MSERQQLALAALLVLVGLALCAVMVVAPTGGSALGVVLVGAGVLVAGGKLLMGALDALKGQDGDK